MLGGFNLLPALPMDGGRIFRALLARRMGRMRATSLAVKVARGVSVGLGLLGLVWGNLFLVGLAVMLWFLAGAELRAARLWQNIGGVQRDGLFGRDEVEVLGRDRRPVEGGANFVVEEQRSNGSRRWIIRDPQGRIIFMAEQPLRW